MAVKTGKDKSKKRASKDKKKASFYMDDLRECIQRGYSGISAKERTKEYDDQRLEVRETCRTSDPRSSNYIPPKKKKK
jgi:hypothetical protein